MGKLIKYEIKKQMLSKIVVGVLLLILEVAFIGGIMINKQELSASSIALMVLLVFV